MKILTLADVPDGLANAWLRHLRNFDAEHTGCHFEVLADAPDMSLPDMVKAMAVDPKLPLIKVIKRGEP